MVPAMDESEKVVFRKLFKGDPREWFAWKPRVKATIDRHDGLLDYLLANRTRPEDEQQLATWKKNSRKVYNILILAVDGEAANTVGQFDEEMDGISAWYALVDQFELKGHVQKAMIYADLLRDKMAYREEPANFFARQEARRRQLRGLGDDVSDSTMLGILMTQLPSGKEYGALETVLYADDLLTLESFKERVQKHYRRVHRIEEHASDSALFAKSKKFGRGGRDMSRIKCHRCGKMGHMKMSCPEADDEQAGCVMAL